MCTEISLLNKATTAITTAIIIKKTLVPILIVSFERGFPWYIGVHNRYG